MVSGNLIRHIKGVLMQPCHQGSFVMPCGRLQGCLPQAIGVNYRHHCKQLLVMLTGLVLILVYFLNALIYWFLEMALV